MDVMESFWKAALSVAGLGAVVAFVLWSLYRQWLKLPILQTLTKEQLYNLFRLLLVLTFLFALAGIIVYVITSENPRIEDDIDPPQTTIGTTPPQIVNVDTATFTFASDEPGSSFECRLDPEDGAGWQTCSSPVEYSNLEDGRHTFQVRSKDRSGNTDPSPSVYTWEVDTAPPETFFMTQGKKLGADSFRFEFTAIKSAVVRVNDPTCTYEYRLNGGDWTACSSPLTVTGLNEGAYDIEIRATDAAGNRDQSPDKQQFYNLN